jgi:hypothetical protein
MAPRFRILISSASKKSEPRYVCVWVKPKLHTHRTLAEVSFSAPHLLHKGLLVSPMKWRCLLSVLYSVRRPINNPSLCPTGKNLVFVLAVRPEMHGAICATVVFKSPHRPNIYLTLLIHTISQQMHSSDSLLVSYSSYMFWRVYVIIREPSFMCPAELH